MFTNFFTESIFLTYCSMKIKRTILQALLITINSQAFIEYSKGS